MGNVLREIGSHSLTLHVRLVHVNLVLSCLKLSLCVRCLSRGLMNLLCDVYVNLRTTVTKIRLLMLAFIVLIFISFFIIFIDNSITVQIIVTELLLWVLIGTEVVLLPLARCLEFVICALVNYLLTRDSIELVVVTVNYQLPNIQKFESIVVPLHN